MLSVQIGKEQINLISFSTDDKHIYLNTYGKSVSDVDNIVSNSDLSEIIIYDDDKIYSRFINYTKLCKLEKNIEYKESNIINNDNSGDAVEVTTIKITLELVDISSDELKKNTEKVTEMQKTITMLTEENSVLKGSISELEDMLCQIMLSSATEKDIEDDLANILLNSIKEGTVDEELEEKEEEIKDES